MTDTETFARFFTVDEANALIPSLRPAVEELLETFRQIRSEIEEAAGEAKVPLGSPELARHLEARAVAPRLFQTVKGLIGQLHSNGCLVDGPEAGRDGFPSLVNHG